MEEAAHRELLEETGYHLTRIISMTPVLFYEPGLSNSDTRVIHAEVGVAALDVIIFMSTVD